MDEPIIYLLYIGANMRTLMYIGSLAMVAAGIFCFANGSAAFLSVAFVVGLVFIIMGVMELLIGKKADFDVFGGGVNLATDGAIMVVFGVVMLSGQITDDITAQMLFAMWLLIEGVIELGSFVEDFRRDAEFDNAAIVVNAAIIILGVYTFFNTRLLNVNAITLIGAALMLLGLRRFRISFGIEYNRVGFLAGNEERLEEAEADEKKALAKAKEGIREQKAAKRRIEKIRENIAQERSIIRDTEIRKQLNKEEKNEQK